MPYLKYKRTQIAEMCPVEEFSQEELKDVSISKPDKENGSPKQGDMIARNPKNYNDKWLVSAQYFKDNFEELK